MARATNKQLQASVDVLTHAAHRQNAQIKALQRQLAAKHQPVAGLVCVKPDMDQVGWFAVYYKGKHYVSFKGFMSAQDEAVRVRKALAERETATVQ